jgi:hypothetical protein
MAGRVPDPFGKGLGPALLEVLADHYEFVAAEPAHCVAVPDSGPQPLTQLHQNRIPGAVADAIIDKFEAVDVDEHHPGPVVPVEEAL